MRRISTYICIYVNVAHEMPTCLQVRIIQLCLYAYMCMQTVPKHMTLAPVNKNNLVKDLFHRSLSF